MNIHCPPGWHESPLTPDDIRQAIDATGMTHVAIAAAMGYRSRATVSKWLSGETRISWPAWRMLLELSYAPVLTPDARQA